MDQSTAPHAELPSASKTVRRWRIFLFSSLLCAVMLPGTGFCRQITCNAISIQPPSGERLYGSTNGYYVFHETNFVERTGLNALRRNLIITNVDISDYDGVLYSASSSSLTPV